MIIFPSEESAELEGMLENKGVVIAMIKRMDDIKVETFPWVDGNLCQELWNLYRRMLSATGIIN